MTTNSTGGSVPSIFFDTTIISGLAKGDLPQAELRAAAQIMKWAQSGQVTVGASTVSRDELDEIPLSKRGPHDEVYNTLSAFKTSSGVTYFDPNTNSVVTNPIYGNLRLTLKDEPDARIIAIGEEHGFEYFVTDDRKTILSRRSDVEAICQIKPRSATEAVKEISMKLSQRST